MKPPAKVKSRSAAPVWLLQGEWLVAAGFFALIFLYVWLRIEPELDYQHSPTAFLLSASFLKHHLTYPGGLVDYGAAFLAQGHYDNRLAAVSFTALCGLVFLATRRVLTGIRGVPPRMAPYGPPFVLLLLLELYITPSWTLALGLLLSLGLAMGCIRLARTRAWPGLTVCWLSAGLVCYSAGVWPCLLLVVLNMSFHVARGRRWRLGLACALSMLVAPLLMLSCGETGVHRLLNPSVQAMPRLVPAAVYVVFSLAAVALAFLPRASAPTEAIPAARPKSSQAEPAPRWWRRNGARRGIAASLLLAGWGTVWLTFDGDRRMAARIDYYASQGEDQKVLAAAARLSAIDPATEVRLHLALFHCGRLGEDLFTWTNRTTWNLMPGLSKGLAACRPQSETLLELGQVSVAEHFAHEALEWEGERPDLLRLLARIHVLKGRPKAARVFLNVLRQIPFQREWAERFLRDLQADPQMPSDQDLARIRSRMVSSDLPHDGMPTESLLRHLLHSNPSNQMAFEYLMAHYLLNRQADQIAAGIGRLNQFAYANIPRHYEEALLLYQQAKPEVQIDLQGRQIRPETHRRYQEFVTAIRGGALESAEGRRSLARDYGDTFWYHYVSDRKTVDRAGP